MDLLIAHLCLAEVMYMLWDLVFYSLYFRSKRAWETREHLLGNVVLGLPICQTVVWVTLDRVLAVKLIMRYKIVVTRQKLYVVIIFIWSISIIQGITYWFAPEKTINLIWIVWDSILASIVVISYIYIIMAVRYQHRVMSESSSRTSPPTLKYRVPLLIVSSFVSLNLIPDIIILTGHDSVWLLNIWFLNYLLDPLFYVFHSRRFRNILCRRAITNTPETIGLCLKSSSRVQHSMKQNMSDATAVKK